MEIFAPQPAILETSPHENQKENKLDTLLTTKQQASQLKNQSKTTFTHNKHEAKTTNIETDLFTAKVSSVNGGSIQGFLLKDFLTTDSLEVNTIPRSKKNNLEIEVKDLNGDPLPLNGNWELSKEPIRTNSHLNKDLEYRLEVFKNKFIKKSLSFSPDNYAIEINLDFSDIKDLIYRDVRFSWKGGLSSTEKDSLDDKTYFKVAVYQGKEIEDLKVKEGQNETKKLNGSTDWGAIRTKYFISALIPKSPESIRYAEISGKSSNQEEYSLSFVFDCFEESAFTLYLGPLEYEKIKALGVELDEIMDFGWSFIRPISKGVLYSLTRMHNYIPNYGVVLIVFSLLVKILVYPLTKKSYQSTSAMQEIQPEVNKLREKFKNNPQKLNQATMQLYKTKGVNPLGGCLPMLLQMPLLFALFQVFRTTIELRNEPFIWWIKDLSAPDVIINLPFSIPLYGSSVCILPLLMSITMFIQQSYTMSSSVDKSQKIMMQSMSVVFFLIFNSFPSGLNLYYTVSNVLNIFQQRTIKQNLNN